MNEIKCKWCGELLGELKGNAFHERLLYSLRLFIIGGVLLIACLTCGNVIIDPAIVKKYKQTKQGETQNANH